MRNFLAFIGFLACATLVSADVLTFSFDIPVKTIEFLQATLDDINVARVKQGQPELTLQQHLAADLKGRLDFLGANSRGQKLEELKSKLENSVSVALDERHTAKLAEIEAIKNPPKKVTVEK